VLIDPQSLDRNSPVPLWFQISEILRKSIESGEIGPGERIDNEIEMAEKFGVSRPTVRQAVHALAQSDLVVRRRGLGTIVAARQMKRPIAFTSLYEDIVSAKRKPATVVLKLETQPASPELAVKLGTSSGALVQMVERLRFADAEPLAIMTNVVPLEVLSKPLTKQELEAGSLYALMKAKGVLFFSAERTIGARNATSRESKMLGISRRATVLTMSSRAMDPVGRTVEIGEHCYVASRYSFEMHLPFK